MRPHVLMVFQTAALLIAMSCLGGYCSEGGQSSYFPGFQDTLAGFLPPPGFYFQEDVYFYTGDTARMVSGGLVKINLHGRLPIQFSIFNQVTKSRLWGSNYSWALVVPLAEPRLTGHRVILRGNTFADGSLSALGEIEIVPLMLGWHNGRSHQKTFIVVYAPTGVYDVNNFVNTSLNRWAVEFDYAYTFLDPKTGLEIDVAPGYTFNTTNPATEYHSGQEFHTDLAAIQHFSAQWAVGAVGYMFFQTTPDTGPGAKLGSFEGRAYALGPILTYNTNAGRVPIKLTGKYYGQFDVTNRFAGHSYWLNVNAAF